ncbi:MAG TPA: 4-(cytidine 5'-diphospho)-2-C-methyl-D-erythritol kinase [Anaerovoracaceae bacterium]|nr:4-(cytidine 5'-diphospho)-2-C-methyl-D-erythritol kinase [Anaerovoracaceae bacterium]
MNKIELNAYAKINLSIDVVEKRPDGYHDVAMVLQQIELCDAVTVKCLDDGYESIGVTANMKAIPQGMDNIAGKAAQLIKDIFPHKYKGSIYINIEKRIPLSAGLAGGSADAAAVLHALNIILKLDLTVSELMQIGVKLGADIPFCIMAQAAVNSDLNLSKEDVSTCALAEGIGDKLTPLPPLEAFVILTKPDISVSTAEIYANLKVDKIKKRPDTKNLIRGLKEKDISVIKKSMYNVLECVSIRRYPVIEVQKQKLEKNAPEGNAIMSGSGPTVFILACEETQAKSIFQNIKNGNSWYCITETSRLSFPCHNRTSHRIEY